MARLNATRGASGPNGRDAILLRTINPSGSATSGKRTVNLVEVLDQTCSELLAIQDYCGTITRLPSDDCAVTAVEAALIGLIVDEAVTNSIKYAHPTGVPGRVTVECQQDHRGGITIEVADDGVGLPENFDPK